MGRAPVLYATAQGIPSSIPSREPDNGLLMPVRLR